MSSQLFLLGNREKLERYVVDLLNSHQLMNYNTVNSPKAVGDAVQGFLKKNISRCLPKELILKINSSFARRSMADFAFENISGNYYVVDIKTHNLDTKFNMLNLTSVERLARFYGDIKNYFALMLVSYTTKEDKLKFTECLFVPIEYLDWECLTFIKKINTENTRKKWMLQLCDVLDLFYPNEIAKITQRIDYFKNIKEYWETQPD
jgi:hypothetical protein